MVKLQVKCPPVWKRPATSDRATTAIRADLARTVPPVKKIRYIFLFSMILLLPYLSHPIFLLDLNSLSLTSGRTSTEGECIGRSFTNTGIPPSYADVHSQQPGRPRPPAKRTPSLPSDVFHLVDNLDERFSGAVKCDGWVQRPVLHVRSTRENNESNEAKYANYDAKDELRKGEEVDGAVKDMDGAVEGVDGAAKSSNLSLTNWLQYFLSLEIMWTIHIQFRQLSPPLRLADEGEVRDFLPWLQPGVRQIEYNMHRVRRELDHVENSELKAEGWPYAQEKENPEKNYDHVGGRAQAVAEERKDVVPRSTKKNVYQEI
ncbi:hypothetical protein B0H19DRAFT_1062708 [Mycena capillaripes]|nr:hypothetical protein B0H19DRAFT_1062708 [Mycena capillaripes]